MGMPGPDARRSRSQRDVSCADAHSIAAQYDLQGDKYQQIDTWTCHSEITATSR